MIHTFWTVCRRRNFLFGAIVGLFFTSSGAGCGEARQYRYSPAAGVNFAFVLRGLDHIEELHSRFLYFDLIVDNRSKSEILFNPGELRAVLNGESNSATYYDSSGSVMTETLRLEIGETSFRLYFVFPENVREDLNDFELVNFGLSVQ